MRAVVQRVSSAAVTVGERTTGRIDRRLLVFVGVEDRQPKTTLKRATTENE